MANEWQIGVILIIIGIIALFLNHKFAKSKSFLDKISKLILSFFSIGLIFTGFCFVIDDVSSDTGDGNDYDYESKYDQSYDDDDYSNPSFKGSETSRKQGKPCHHRDYGVGNYSECSDRGNCSGFSSKNRDAYSCSKCDHNVDEHY